MPSRSMDSEVTRSEICQSAGVRADGPILMRRESTTVWQIIAALTSGKPIIRGVFI